MAINSIVLLAEKVYNVSLAFLFFGFLQIRGNQSQFCVRRWLCDASIPRIAWYHIFCARQYIQVVMGRALCVKRATVWSYNDFLYRSDNRENKNQEPIAIGRTIGIWVFDGWQQLATKQVFRPVIEKAGCCGFRERGWYGAICGYVGKSWHNRVEHLINRVLFSSFPSGASALFAALLWRPEPHRLNWLYLLSVKSLKRVSAAFFLYKLGTRPLV